MCCVLAAEAAILVKLDTIWVVFFVFHSIVISLLAFATSQSNLYAHVQFPPARNTLINYQAYAQKDAGRNILYSKMRPCHSRDNLHKLITKKIRCQCAIGVSTELLIQNLLLIMINVKSAF